MRRLMVGAGPLVGEEDGSGELDEPDGAADDEGPTEARVGLAECRCRAAGGQHGGDPGGYLECESRVEECKTGSLGERPVCR
jgi:hypothetical protein